MRRFQHLTEALPHMVWSCRASDGACTYLSPQWVAYTGIPEAAQLGFGWLEQLHPEDRARTMERWTEAAATGSAFDTEFRIRRHDGIYRWFKTRAVCVDGEGGAIWYGSNTDIQELREAQAALDAANAALAARVEERTRELASVAEQLKRAQRVAKMGSWSFDPRREEVRWSDELFRIFRLPIGEEAMPYAAQASLFAPASWRSLQDAIARATAEGVGYELTLEIVRADGSTGLAHARAEVVRGDDGAALLVGTFQDITEREATAVALRLASERLRLAETAAHLGVWEWNLETDALVWDAGMHELYGISPADFPGTIEAWRAVIHPDDAPGVQATVTRALASAMGFEVPFRIRRGDGQLRHVRGFGNIRRDEHGRVSRVVGASLDVTAQRIAELEMQQLNQQLEERGLQQEALLQEVHHRVKNNLQIIASIMNLQLRKLGDPAARGALEECRSRVQSIALIHEQLYATRDYARVPIGQYAAALARNIVAAAVDGSRITVRLEIAPVDVSVDTAIPCGLILNELLTNAVKHAFPDGRSGTITVSLARQGDHIRFAVSDDGIGRPEVPANPASLGLQLVTTLVRQLHGVLEVSHAHGTTCAVSFPLVAE